MKFKLIQAFVEVAESGSVSDAARNMKRSRSQMSTWISDLEIDWGFQLFDRSGYRPVLTGYGEQLLPLCRQVLNHVSHLEKRVEHLGRMDEGALNLGFDSLIPRKFRTHLIASVYHEFPDLRLSVSERPEYYIAERLITGEFHMGIGHLGLPQLDKELKSYHAGNLQFAICAHKNHVLASYDEVTEDDLKQYRGLLLNEVKDYLPAEMIDTYIIMPDFDSIIEMARMGSGWCIAPAADVKPFLNSGELVVLNHISGIIRIGVGGYWHRPGLLNKPGRWLIENLERLWNDYQQVPSEK